MPPQTTLERAEDLAERILPERAPKRRMLVIVNPYATTVSDRLKNLVIYAPTALPGGSTNVWCRTVGIVDDRPFPLWVDGDYIGVVESVRYGVVPGGLLAVA